MGRLTHEVFACLSVSLWNKILSLFMSTWSVIPKLIHFCNVTYFQEKHDNILWFIIHYINIYIYIKIQTRVNWSQVLYIKLWVHCKDRKKKQ